MVSKSVVGHGIRPKISGQGGSLSADSGDSGGDEGRGSSGEAEEAQAEAEEQALGAERLEAVPVLGTELCVVRAWEEIMTTIMIWRGLVYHHF